MKNKARVSSQVLILVLAASVVLFMVQVVEAQETKDEDKNSLTSSNLISQNNASQMQGQQGQLRNGPQVLQIDMPQKSTGRKILENTSLTYYQQFLGPTMAGSSNETYNVFQEGLNQPGTGRAPLQSFHSVNMRYQINSDWAVGASLAAVNGYTKEVTNEHKSGNVTNRPDSEFFNARAYVSMPAYHTTIGTLYSNLAYEAPTSVTSRNQKMTWGWVLNESFTLKLPSPKWTVGVLGQYYRAYFDHARNVEPPPFPGGLPTPLQTVIVSGGPFANYRFNDHWQATSVVTLDWDQRGVQTDSREFNNNLPHRGRLGLNYFPSSIKYLSNVGVFTQGLLKFSPRTTAVGADFSVKF